MIDFVMVGMKISEYRRKANLTQDALAEKLFVTRQALSKWETGSGVPSVDTLLNICQIFNVTFEEILCLNDNKQINIDYDDIFYGHERAYIINKIITNEITINLPDVFYQFSPAERMLVLKAIKEKRIKQVNINELKVKLTMSEQKYLNDYFRIGG